MAARIAGEPPSMSSTLFADTASAERCSAAIMPFTRGIA
jgi:hypothetical protein